MLIIAIPERNPRSKFSADSSIVSALKSSFGNEFRKKFFTSIALDGSFNLTKNEPVSPSLSNISRKVSM